jgi:aldehyde:ferredoxin oxidoreductase
MMVDYSDEGIYADSTVELVAWHRHYTRYYKQSYSFCDWCYANIINPLIDDKKGLTGVAEPRFVNAVTGKNETFEEGMEMGRKIWNFDRALLCLRGRNAEMEHYTGYSYKVPLDIGYTAYELPYVLPAFIDGEWKFEKFNGRTIDYDKHMDWMQRYYAFEGWNTNGIPTRETLESLDLKELADALEKAGKY